MQRLHNPTIQLGSFRHHLGLRPLVFLDEDGLGAGLGKPNFLLHP